MKVQEVITRQQRYLKDSTLNANIIDWINLALQEIYLEGRFPWARKEEEITYDTTKEYAEMPSDVLKIQYIRTSDEIVDDITPLEGNQVLGSSGYRWYESGLIGDKANGYKRTLVLKPTPTENVLLWLGYYRSPDTMEAADDYLPIPDGAEAAFHELISWYRLDYEEETGTSQQIHLQRYSRLLKRTIDAMYPDYDTTDQKVTQVFSETGFPYP